MSPSLDDLRQAALDAARAAGALLLAHRAAGVTAEWKGAIDPVSAADRAAESRIRSLLGEADPTIPVLGEEGGDAPIDTTGAHWVVDPLDGTTNFLHGSDHFAVSIAHVDDAGSTDVAVVHAPALATTWHAVRGGGAWRSNGTPTALPLHVTSEPRLDRALVATGFPYVFEGDETDDLAAVVPNVLSMRSLGASAVELCLVADGHLDAFWERGLGPWDTAAGVLIAREAGAEVTDVRGAPVHGPTRDVVAGNPALVRELLALLQR
jgi:myo-inositol-1(or 4)-monophosphatase